MCTIALIHRVRADEPLVVAANRDEFYARPASAPAVLDPARGVVGGRDHKGGTWMGVTRGGIFVGLTNQRTVESPPPEARSRGEVVLGALRAGAVRAAVEWATRLDPGEFPPFNLVIGDGEALVVLYARRDRWEREELGPGVHVLANDRLGSPWFPKADRLKSVVEGMMHRPWDALRDGLARALADTTVPEEVPADPASPLPEALTRALQALCIRTELYGTRSATIAALGRGRVRDYRFSAGPPDEHPFEDLTELVNRA